MSNPQPNTAPTPPAPVPMQTPNALLPFLLKTYDMVDGQALPFIPVDDVDMVPNDLVWDASDIESFLLENSNLVDEMDAFIDPDMFQSDIESFLLNLLDEKWNSNLMVDMDEIIAGLEMDSVPPVDDYLMQESEDKPLENASPTDQVQRLTQRMGQAPFFTD